MSRSTREVKGDWDTMRLAYYDERVIERIAEVSGVGEDSEVADIGTGTGFVAAGIAPRVRRVIGIDNAPAMLEVARENLLALGASNVDLLAGEVSRLPLEDCSVDAVFANMVLHLRRVGPSPKPAIGSRGHGIGTRGSLSQIFAPITSRA